MANATMMPPPGVDISDWIDAQRQQQVSDVLTQAAFSSPIPQQPSGGGKYYVQARTSPLSIGAKMAEALMARKAFNKSATLNAQNYAKALSAFSGPTTEQAQVAPASSREEQTVQPASGLTPPVTRQGGPLGIPGIDPRTAMNLYMSKPEEYAKLKLGPDQVRLGTIAGMTPQGAAGAAFTKQNALEARPGGATYLPNGQVIRNPTLATGEVPIFDQQGNIVGTRLLPGHLADQAALAGAETGAKEANTPMRVPMGGGREGFMYPGQVPGLGAPPALRQPPSNSAGAPQYFGPPPTPKSPIVPPAATPKPQQPDWLANAPKLTIPNTPGQSTDSYHQKILDKAADKHIELADKYGSEADLADARTAFNNEALKVLKGADTGPLSDELTKLRARALELGIPAKWIPGADTVGDTQKLKKFLLRNPLLSLKPTFGGRPAASEFQVLKEEASPSPTMLKSTIAKLVEMDTEQANYVKRRAHDYGDYHEAGGDPTRFESYYANTHSFAKALDNYSKASTATPEEIAAEMKRRGFQ